MEMKVGDLVKIIDGNNAPGQIPAGTLALVVSGDGWSWAPTPPPGCRAHLNSETVYSLMLVGHPTKRFVTLSQRKLELISESR